MKKIVLIISFLIPAIVFGQGRVLNGRYNDGQSFGKPINDTVRRLIAESPLFLISGGTSYVDTARFVRDTSALFAFGGGGGNAGDTASFSTSTIYGAFFNSLSDTLNITSMQIGLQGSSPSVTVRVYWNDSLNVTAGATPLTTSGTNATNTTTGTTVTSFANTKIPPNVWVWCVTSAVTTKPTFMSVTLIGYKKQIF
jgi:hypothetical protein